MLSWALIVQNTSAAEMAMVAGSNGDYSAYMANPRSSYIVNLSIRASDASYAVAEMTTLKWNFYNNIALKQSLANKKEYALWFGGNWFAVANWTKFKINIYNKNKELVQTDELKTFVGEENKAAFEKTKSATNHNAAIATVRNMWGITDPGEDNNTSQAVTRRASMSNISIDNLEEFKVVKFDFNTLTVGQIAAKFRTLFNDAFGVIYRNMVKVVDYVSSVRDMALETDLEIQALKDQNALLQRYLLESLSNNLSAKESFNAELETLRLRAKALGIPDFWTDNNMMQRAGATAGTKSHASANWSNNF